MLSYNFDVTKVSIYLNHSSCFLLLRIGYSKVVTLFMDELCCFWGDQTKLNLQFKRMNGVEYSEEKLFPSLHSRTIRIFNLTCHAFIFKGLSTLLAKSFSLFHISATSFMNKP
jgi:hypothetical protein